ncbi:MAG: alkaline phosphatase [Planctomycetota bacterium]
MNTDPISIHRFHNKIIACSRCLLYAALSVTVGHAIEAEEPADDPMRQLQEDSVKTQKPVYGHWGNQPDKFSAWVNHSNRLIPVYTFGWTLDALRERGSVYQDPKRLARLYGEVPKSTVNPVALYFDQTDLYDIQKAAYESGIQNVILMVFDGMDWQTTRAAAIYKNGADQYQSGRGTGLTFQDYRVAPTDFGLVVTSPARGGCPSDVDAQTTDGAGLPITGGYDVSRGGRAPWLEQTNRGYLIGNDREMPHTVTDSAASATSFCSGVKTYNGAINVLPDGTQVTPIARYLQSEHEAADGIVTSFPKPHATPGAAYANNVSRKDYQDIARDLLGLRSSSHRRDPLPGVDVLIGGGYGEGVGEDELQGNNFAAGNKYVHEEDVRRIDVDNGGRYIVAKRTKDVSGSERLMEAASRAVRTQQRLFGFYGTRGGHLPFQTADGKFNPSFDVKGHERYSEADLYENPTLADMTRAALLVLEQSIDGFWLMIEAGDVDWANHANNLDSSIGAVLSGEKAFEAVVDWIQDNRAWDVTCVIVTADHGHYLVIDHPERLAAAGRGELELPEALTPNEKPR